MGTERNATRQSGFDNSALHISECTSILTELDIEDFNDAFPLAASTDMFFRALEILVFGYRFGQLSPNTYTVLVAYIIKCGKLGYEPSLEVWYWMFGLSPCREGKLNVESGYYTFSAATKGKKATKYGVVKTRSNVHNWKHKFVLVSCRTWGVSTQQREVYMKPTTQMRSYLNAEERALLETFQSEGKKFLDEWFDVVTLDNIEYYGIAKRTHPRVPKLL
ncbi:hypothetical protein Dimus_028757 [Dionaea muscipula]